MHAHVCVCGRMHACMLTTIGVYTMTRMCDPNDLMSAALNHCQQAELMGAFQPHAMLVS